jgi:Tetratricopeptide repeat
VQVMETRKRVLGAEHPDMLTSMVSLAFTLKSQSRKEAISLMKKSFQLRKQILGPHHPNTEFSLEALDEWQMEDIEIGL